MAEDFGIGSRTLGYIEGGKWTPRLDEAHAWAGYFGVSLGDLFYPARDLAGQENEDQGVERDPDLPRNPQSRPEWEEEDRLYLRFSVLTRLLDYGPKKEAEVIEMLRLSCREPQKVTGEFEAEGLVDGFETDVKSGLFGRTATRMLHLTDAGRLWVMDLYESGQPEWVSRAGRRQRRRVVFAGLWRKGMVSANSLEKDTALPPTNIFELLERMYEEGLVDIRIVGGSPRHVGVSLNEEGSLEAEAELGRVGYRISGGRA